MKGSFTVLEKDSSLEDLNLLECVHREQLGCPHPSTPYRKGCRMEDVHVGWAMGMNETWSLSFFSQVEWLNLKTIFVCTIEP